MWGNVKSTADEGRRDAGMREREGKAPLGQKPCGHNQGTGHPHLLFDTMVFKYIVFFFHFFASLLLTFGMNCPGS